MTTIKNIQIFNTLGLYRSILENKNLSIADKLEVRDYANKTFKKTFLFLQLKDPKTYFDIITLGQEITRGDEQKIWSDIITSQQAILTEKKLNTATSESIPNTIVVTIPVP